MIAMMRRRFLVNRKEYMFDGNGNEHGNDNKIKIEIEIESYLTEHNRKQSSSKSVRS